MLYNTVCHYSSRVTAVVLTAGSEQGLPVLTVAVAVAVADQHNDSCTSLHRLAASLCTGTFCV
jgi:hypothetical protein